MGSVLRRFAFVLALAMLPAACLQISADPLFLHKGTRFDAALVGDWRCGGEVWTFEQAKDEDMFDGPIYGIKIVEDSETVEVGAALGSIGGTDFITFWPDHGPTAVNSFYKRHFLPGFSFGRVRIDKDRVQLALLSDDWVHKAAEARRLPKELRLSSASNLLIATPAELQRFARAHATDEEAFSEKIELMRNRADLQAQPGRCYSEK